MTDVINGYEAQIDVGTLEFRTLLRLMKYFASKRNPFVRLKLLTLKGPIRTAAEDKFATSFPIFEKK